jgi:hypothetical protein
MNIALPDRVAIPEHVVFQELENECVLLNMSSEQYFGLDDVGTRIWKLLADEGETRTVLARLQDHYQVSEATLRQDLAGFIDKLQAEGLLAAS